MSIGFKDNSHKIKKTSKCCGGKVVEIDMGAYAAKSVYICIICGKKVKAGQWNAHIIEGCEAL